MVTTQANNATDLKIALDTHKKRIVEKSLSALAPNNKSKNPVKSEHIINFIDGMTHRLEEVTEQMSEADLLHTRESLETKQARSRRDKAFKAATNGYLSLKHSMLASYGPDIEDILSIGENVPRTPSDMSRKLHSIMDIIDEGHATLPAPLNPMFPVWNLKQIYDFVKTLAKELDDTLKLVSTELQEDKGSLTRKWELMEEQHLLYTSLASISESLARMAGDSELAKRLRPRMAQGRRKVDDNTEPTTNNVPPTEPTTETE
tara:strand:- start:345 stop:1127 length:783 start_codon:yes stop_codon:yes gene_type:complete